MTRNLILVLGDQLNRDNPALLQLDPSQDRVLMIERLSESQHVWSHKARTTLFLSAMRHFATELRSEGIPLDYVELEDAITEPFFTMLGRRVQHHAPVRVMLCEPGEYRMLAGIQDICFEQKVPLTVMGDTHFICSREEFSEWAGDKKHLLMESFYRHMRRKTGILMSQGDPEGGEWNYDRENRRAYPKCGPGEIAPPAHFAPDGVTRGVMFLVEKHLADHPGALADFGWPVTRAEALHALDQFVSTRLGQFGNYQDAMWAGEPFGWHALLSPALNLKLISPAEVLHAALAAYRTKGLPLASVEGFVRQVLGWREFIRGVYWLDAPQMRTSNHFGHQRALPAWYWTGKTHMNCMKESIGQTLQYGFAHHIQRLMVTGNFALLARLNPQAVEDWYLAVYVDAVEWVELPNTAGMALYATGARFTSKPYIASGAYINRMSNYCKGCRYQPQARTGPTACPMTTLYWNFLDTHETQLFKNMRTVLMAKSVQRLGPEERSAIRSQAGNVMEHLDSL